MKVAKADDIAAVLDACVLAPMPLCDTLLRCAGSHTIFHLFWSSETLREVSATLEKFGYSRVQAERRVHAMQQAFPEALIDVPRRSLRAFPNLPDPNDTHVVAAAVQASARVIVTFNSKHFPRKVLDVHGISACSPDEFMMGLLTRNADRISEIIDAQARTIGETRERILERLAPGLPEFVRLMKCK